MIGHIDADSFFASVLVRLHPHLEGKPLLALGMGGSCIIAASYEAKAYGVKTGMRLKDAKVLVPHAIEMAADFKETALASKQIEVALQDLCPVIEQMSIDEWYLDLRSLVGGVPEDLESWAKRTRECILHVTGLSMSLGISPTKTLAKMASEYRKPGGITVIKNKNREEFLRDRPLGAIGGIGKQRSKEMMQRQYKTAWDIACAPDSVLQEVCGKTGIELKRELSGTVIYRVTSERKPPKSISRCRAFKATQNRELLKAHLVKHLEYCTMKMRRQGLACTGCSLWLRRANLEGVHAHRRLAHESNTASQMLPIVLQALAGLMEPAERYNQIGLALHGLVASGTAQPSLFDDEEQAMHDEHVQAAIDALHARYGRDSVTRGTALAVKSGTVLDLDYVIVD